MHHVFANRMVSRPVAALVKKIEYDCAFVILDGMNVDTRRSIESVPATVVAADESGTIDRRGYALAARLYAKLKVDQKVGARRVTDLH